MTVDELRSKVSGFIQVMIPLAEAHPCENRRTALLAIMEGSLRKNVMRVQAINLLCDEEKLADFALELTRNVIEDVVSIEYMLASTEPEKMAQKFYEFRWVQLKEDLDYYKLVGIQANSEDLPDAEERIEEGYVRVIGANPDFLNKDGKPVRSWPRRDVEMMLSSMKDKKVLSVDQIKALVRIYVYGCRKTHFNPVELMTYMEQATWDRSSRDSRKLALLVASSSLVRLGTRYIDLISTLNGRDTYHDIGDKANAFLDELHSIDELTA